MDSPKNEYISSAVQPKEDVQSHGVQSHIPYIIMRSREKHVNGHFQHAMASRDHVKKNESLVREKTSREEK